MTSSIACLPMSQLGVNAGEVSVAQRVSNFVFRVSVGYPASTNPAHATFQFWQLVDQQQLLVTYSGVK